MEREFDTPKDSGAPATADEGCLNTLDLMDTIQDGAKKGTDDFNAAPAEPGDAANAIGDAWLDCEGTIQMRLRSSSDGQPIDALFSYPKGDPAYDAVLKHLNGLKPGEKKLVPPWK